MTAIEKILSDYEIGNITERERVVALARLITPDTVEATFASIPPEIREELLNWARIAPLEGGVVIGGELSREAGGKLAGELRKAVLTIRSWKEGGERNGGPSSQQPAGVCTKPKA